MNTINTIVHSKAIGASDIPSSNQRVLTGVNKEKATEDEISDLRSALDNMEAERDRLLRHSASLYQLASLSSDVIEHLSEKHRDQLNAPGHAHTQPGVWDGDNLPSKANKPCKWCATWPQFKHVTFEAKCLTQDLASHNEQAYSTGFKPGFIEMRRIITQSWAISKTVNQIREVVESSIDSAVLNSLDEIEDYANTIISMATILEPKTPY